MNTYVILGLEGGDLGNEKPIVIGYDIYYILNRLYVYT
jgi:hypothetical protein